VGYESGESKIVYINYLICVCLLRLASYRWDNDKSFIIYIAWHSSFGLGVNTLVLHNSKIVGYERGESKIVYIMYTLLILSSVDR